MNENETLCQQGTWPHQKNITASVSHSLYFLLSVSVYVSLKDPFVSVSSFSTTLHLSPLQSDCLSFPAFHPSKGEMGDSNFEAKKKNKKLAETFDVFSPLSCLRNVISIRGAQKQRVADKSQGMPTAPCSSCKSLYCYCG